jgi:hypothetical protein
MQLTHHIVHNFQGFKLDPIIASSSFFLVVGCKAIVSHWFEVDPSFYVVGFAFDGFVLKSREHFTH